jgi:hypothetical protein
MYDTSPSEAQADQVIDEVASRFRERNVPHLWFLNEDSRPPFRPC